MKNDYLVNKFYEFIVESVWNLYMLEIAVISNLQYY